MCKKEDSSLCFGIGILAGVLGGLITAVMYAPKSGKETREKISNTVTEFVEKNSPKVNEIKRKTIDTLDVLKCKVEKKCETFNNAMKAKNLAKAKEKEFQEYNFD